jgi:hypothetical protein
MTGQDIKPYAGILAAALQRHFASGGAPHPCRLATSVRNLHIITNLLSPRRPVQLERVRWLRITNARLSTTGV